MAANDQREHLTSSWIQWQEIAIIKNNMMACITNLSNLRQQIIRLIGETTGKVYGLMEPNSS
jgi:hypothetical protein